MSLCKIFRFSSYQDELGWAGVWLYQATGDSKYLTEAETNRVSGAAWGDSWDDKTAVSYVLNLSDLAVTRMSWAGPEFGFTRLLGTVNI